MTKAELEDKITGLEKENAILRAIQEENSASPSINTTQASGTCPACGFNAQEHAQLVSEAMSS